MTRPTRGTSAGRAYNDLRNLARRDGRDGAEYLTLYALEGFLARLAASKHAAGFVLKGGVLMAAFAARRPTRDVDLAASGFPNDIDDVAERVRQIVAVDLDDGLEFDLASVFGWTRSSPSQAQYLMAVPRAGRGIPKHAHGRRHGRFRRPRRGPARSLRRSS
ncbi:nucleotidyl transferase AbiEii/AbiGii toxin family protein [Promicromonospora panici]|uniref:nucleotidyl transferase AbiEii/AbiGii toxin family protein n=1 Tax=Promicromonospora panici TaxID=2219658 RepID=UPI001A917863|nr:nucleotidyl transferase AbiEii/AbiGii toxin family protein [Promicromonospora panici]